MVSNISFIQANLQHSIFATKGSFQDSKCLGNRHGTDTGTVVLQGLYQGPEYSRIYAVLHRWNR
jgi:hypothetical protein